MTIQMKWEFFPTIFYTTKYWYRKKDNEWVKNIFLPLIEKDILEESCENLNWDCNVKTNFHFKKNFLNAYKHLYECVIWEFCKAVDIDEKAIKGWNISAIWHNSYKLNEYQEKHDHYPHHFSLIHYLEYDNKEHAPTKFFNPLQQATALTKKEMNNRMNMEHFQYEDTEEGNVVIFPGFVPHLVPSNKSEKRRTTIALNFDLITK